MVTICPQVNVCGEQLLVSLVQAVPVKVRLRIEVVVGGHLLVQPKVLHPHCLQKICQQCFKSS